MATFDISRVAFDPRKHYSSVRMQQGRVLTDDDYNEGRRIEDEIQRRTQTDVIGGYGSPDDGFKIVDLVNGVPNFDFGIHDGSIYLGGIRWEMEKTHLPDNAAEVYETYLKQRDWLTMVPIPAPNTLPAGIRYDLVYLHAWQQPICAIEDTALFEVALNAFDTTTRLRNMRRVEIFTDSGSPECAISWKKLRTKWVDDHVGKINPEYERIRNIKLSVGFTGGQPAEDLCSPSIAGGYLGAENQAIRVQLTAPDKFTWGYDNASPFYRVKIDPGSKTVTMMTLPKDQYHWPMTGQVVEILACSAVLPNNERIAAQSGFISRVAGSYNPDTQTFTMEDPLAAGFGNGWLPPVEYLYLRVWNRGTDLTSPKEIPFVENTPVTLGNTGLQVTLSKWTTDRDMEPVAEDYWVIAARPETPDVIVPWELKEGIRPMGVRRYFAPLAIIEWTAVAGGTVQGRILHDCRRPFRPLTEQECCCTFTVGDGINSKGDFQSIQEAIDNLPPEGGKICVLSGIHEANAVIHGQKKIHISGCGEQTIVRTPEGSNKPIFLIENSQKIKLDNMTLFTLTGVAILVQDSPDQKLLPSEGITLRDNRILAFIHAIRVELQADVSGDNNIKILYNQIGMFDKIGGDVAIFSLADGVLIEQNRIVKIAAPRGEDGGDDPGDEPPGDVFDPCEGLKKTYEKNEKFRQIIFLSLGYVAHYVPGGIVAEINALGGIQIGGGSERVIILRNEIFGGKGNGVTLGHEHKKGDKAAFSVFLYDITIQANVIREMGLSGIGTILHPEPDQKNVPIHIENLLIVENDIKYCVLEILDREERLLLSTELPVSAISLAMCEDCIIRENWLEENGKVQPQPVCGVFIFYGEKIDVINNRIINNGPELLKETPQNASPRGGIVILFAFKLPQPAKTGLNTNTTNTNLTALFTAQDTVPAARIHDNIVSQPLGQALLLIALGPVSVVSNQFTSQGIYKGQSLSLLAGAVYILDVGLSKDLINILIPARQWTTISPAAVLALVGTNSPKSLALALLLQLFPSGKVMYTANQTTLDMRSFDRDVAISSQLIFSWDDIAFVNNQSECAGLVAALPHTPTTFDLVLFNTVLLAPSVRCNDNRFTDGFTLTLLSLLSMAFLNTAVNNQSTHCLVVPFWIFRRKFLNIELNTLACATSKLEFNLSRPANAGNEQFNYPKF